MKTSKLLVESWRTFVNEGWYSDSADPHTIHGKAIEEGRREPDPARVKRAEDAKTPDDDTWARFKQEKEKGTAQEKEKSWQERESTTVLYKNLDFLMKSQYILSNNSKGGLFSGFGDKFTTRFDGYRATSEELRAEIRKNAAEEISKDKKNPLNTIRIKGYLSKGRYGLVYELANDHVLKIFQDGMNGVQEDLKWYKNLHDRQFTKQSEPGEMAVYAYGLTKFPDQITDGDDGFAYAEVGKVIPFGAYLNMHKADTYTAKTGFDDLRSFVSEDGADRSYMKNPEPPLFAKISTMDENKYAAHVVDVLSKHRKWTIPEKATGAWSVKTLKDVLVAVYRLAKQAGDEYLFQRGTYDIHSENFGFNIQTGHVVVFDK